MKDESMLPELLEGEGIRIEYKERVPKDRGVLYRDDRVRFGGWIIDHDLMSRHSR